jgi:hypothetical protein
MLPEDGSPEPEHVAIKRTSSNKGYKKCCVDGIYSNLNYTRNRKLNTRMKNSLNSFFEAGSLKGKKQPFNVIYIL